MNIQDKIVRRFFLSIDIMIESPICIGSGANNNTDMDVIRDYDGTPFIPASSIAGVLKDSLVKSKKYSEDFLNKFWGDKSERVKIKDEKMSCITVYDSEIFDCKIEERDMVKLTEGKVSDAKGKFDQESIVAGAKFKIRLECVIRENLDSEYSKLKESMAYIVSFINNGLIRFGSKTRRGFGKLSINKNNIVFSEYPNESAKLINWLDFDWVSEDLKNNKSNIEFLKLVESVGKINLFYTRIKVLLKIPYSINIKSYSRELGGTDNEMFKTSRTKKIVSTIPGTTWAGAIRHRFTQVLKELNCKKNSDIINNWFGFVKGNMAKSSSIIFDESYIYNNKDISVTRVKIDRFSGGVVKGALFNEKPSYEGNTELFVSIENDNYLDAKIGMMLLCIKDLFNGVLSVGGETNIGRGIFESETKNIYDSIFVNEKLITEENYNKYISDLAEFINGGFEDEAI